MFGPVRGRRRPEHAIGHVQLELGLEQGSQEILGTVDSYFLVHVLSPVITDLIFALTERQVDASMSSRWQDIECVGCCTVKKGTSKQGTCSVNRCGCEFPRDVK